MSEPQADLEQPERICPPAPRRAIADWEYRTAYLDFFQVRIPTESHDRLCEWARQDRKPLGDLCIETLEEAVRRREGQAGWGLRV